MLPLLFAMGSCCEGKAVLEAWNLGLHVGCSVVSQPGRLLLLLEVGHSQSEAPVAELLCLQQGGRRACMLSLDRCSSSLLGAHLSLIVRFMHCATYPTAALTSTEASDLGTEAVSRMLGEFCVESEHPQGLENQDSMLPVNLIVLELVTHLQGGVGEQVFVSGEGSLPRLLCIPLAA